MSKKSKSKIKEVKLDPKNKIKSKVEADENEAIGLPDMDFKKFLGCGG